MFGGFKRKGLQSSQMTIGAAGLDCTPHGSHAAFGDQACKSSGVAFVFGLDHSSHLRLYISKLVFLMLALLFAHVSAHSTQDSQSLKFNSEP